MSSTTTTIFAIPPTDSIKAVTINFIDLLWFNNLNGRRVLNNLSTLIALRSIEVTLISIRLDTTIKKSN